MSKRTQECHDSETCEPEVDGSWVPSWKKQDNENGQDDKRRDRKETPMKEIHRQQNGHSEKDELHKQSRLGYTEQDRHGDEQDPKPEFLSGCYNAKKRSMTDSANPVWIVLNVLVKTGSVDVGGSSSTLTGGEKRPHVAVFETNATLH